MTSTSLSVSTSYHLPGFVGLAIVHKEGDRLLNHCCRESLPRRRLYGRPQDAGSTHVKHRLCFLAETGTASYRVTCHQVHAPCGWTRLSSQACHVDYMNRLGPKTPPREKAVSMGCRSKRMVVVFSASWSTSTSVGIVHARFPLRGAKRTADVPTYRMAGAAKEQRH